MSVFLVEINSDLDASDVHDTIKYEWSCDLSVQQVEVVNQPEPAGREGQMGLVYRVLDTA